MPAKSSHLKRTPEAAAVWKYDRPDGKHSIIIHRFKDNLFAIASRGIAYQEGCSLAFDFIIDTVKHSGKRIRCLLDNTGLISVDWSFKLLFLKFPLANECFHKIATCGDNLYLQSFGRIYQYTFGRKFKIRSFKHKEVALAWLEKE
ncbi:MAG: hypothetical protein JW822_08960 [Spirochaetales bacterium]|nr:hypothetical protein [Spirochaetales bacterium]